MSEISNDQIYETLLDVQKDIGGLLATVSQHQRAFVEHVKEDAEMGDKITQINLHLAKQRGAIGVWGAIATGAATLAGVAVQFFRSH